jgi:subtilisin-like proprotein convertase family protein
MEEDMTKRHRFLTNRGRRLIGLALTFTALFGWMASQIVVITPPAHAQSKSGVTYQSKEAMLERMIELDSEIADRKAQLAANPKDAALQSSLSAALAEYEQISNALGGDRASAMSDHLLPVQNAPAAVPTPPPGCPAATITTGSNNTPVPIPDSGGPVASSTINIAGAGTYLFDVDVTVNITHTFPGDLDITLQSPSGKIVTLSSDNGASNDNVWAGTTFDDQANPGGQVPYVTNAGLVNDHPYGVGVVVPLLAPEEALALFTGDNPNGTWTITIDDDAGGDTGTLNSWSLSIATLPAAPTNAAPVTASNNTPVPIPDSGGPVASSTINIAGAGTYTCDVNVTVNITHTFPGDLDITLQSPSGKIVTLSSDNGASNDNVWAGTTFDDQANPGGQVPYDTNAGLVGDHPYAIGVVVPLLAPEEALALFTGDDPNGTWTITIDDDAGGDTGTLNSWSLSIVTCACAASCALTCPANVTQSNDPNQCGAVVNYPAPTTTGTCGTVTCIPPSGSFFPVGTTTVTCTSTAGPSCTFTVTVNDTQPPTITCPGNQTVVTDQTACGGPGGVCQVVNFTTTASDNCPGVVVLCNPPSGSCFPVGVTTVTCTATDASGNTATCSFTVTAFDVALQDDSDPSIVLLWNSITGQYRFCCKGTTFTGVGKSTIQGCVFTLQHNPADRRVLGRVDKAVHAGTASIQAPPGSIRCTITDRNTLNDTPTCQ